MTSGHDLEMSSVNSARAPDPLLSCPEIQRVAGSTNRRFGDDWPNAVSCVQHVQAKRSNATDAGFMRYSVLHLRQQFLYTPLMIGDPRFHRRGDAQVLMNPTEVVIRVPERNSGPVVFPLLAERICQARKSAGPMRTLRLLRSMIEVQMRSGSGLLQTWDHRHGLVDLDEYGVINVIAERVRNYL
jgi:hypothetical protein